MSYQYLVVDQMSNIWPVFRKGRRIFRILRPDPVNLYVLVMVPVPRWANELIDFFGDHPVFHPNHTHLTNAIGVGEGGFKIKCGERFVGQGFDLFRICTIE